MVCRSINSICPIHAFLLSLSVQATGGGSCWAVLPSLIFKGYKLHYPAQSEPAWTVPSIHPFFLWLPSPSFWMLLSVVTSIFLSIVYPSLHFLLSWWLMGVVQGALSISFHRHTRVGKPTNTQPVHELRCYTHEYKRKTRARQKQQRQPHRFNGKTSHSVWVRQH